MIEVRRRARPEAIGGGMVAGVVRAARTKTVRRFDGRVPVARDAEKQPRCDQAAVELNHEAQPHGTGGYRRSVSHPLRNASGLARTARVRSARPKKSLRE